MSRIYYEGPKGVVELNLVTIGNVLLWEITGTLTGSTFSGRGFSAPELIDTYIEDKALAGELKSCLVK